MKKILLIIALMGFAVNGFAEEIPLLGKIGKPLTDIETTQYGPMHSGVRGRMMDFNLWMAGVLFNSLEAMHKWRMGDHDMKKNDNNPLTGIFGYRAQYEGKNHIFDEEHPGVKGRFYYNHDAWNIFNQSDKLSDSKYLTRYWMNEGSHWILGPSVLYSLTGTALSRDSNYREYIDNEAAWTDYFMYDDNGPSDDFYYYDTLVMAYSKEGTAEHYYLQKFRDLLADLYITQANMGTGAVFPVFKVNPNYKSTITTDTYKSGPGEDPALGGEDFYIRTKEKMTRTQKYKKDLSWIWKQYAVLERMQERVVNSGSKESVAFVMQMQKYAMNIAIHMENALVERMGKKELDRRLQAYDRKDVYPNELLRHKDGSLYIFKR